MIYAIYGEGIVKYRTCQKWFAKFRSRDFSLKDAPQSNRPVGLDQIKTVLENNQKNNKGEEEEEGKKNLLATSRIFGTQTFGRQTFNQMDI